MTVTRQLNGSYEISDMVEGHRLARSYYGYTRKEAISLFRAARREELNWNVKGNGNDDPHQQTT